uniref:4-guanidinobutyraldehyde dehydrogenase / NAD-dependent aldehyde dehydrogenase n=1 Tax=Candidatus Kentrum sp. SD TaxID=2126332 RepID=A0A450YWG3_9GAMM|nr:MAG: 4-guanidinobutyraldehyde dehydrogenase / NAD-dependent aldehyde dehydrogenase [Candidatus Kentron sp. SD]VFK45911.1 MAG: 4-guanidinobutyraldehyde dehydrogenase / NAD-dependent aldehyde dehydrogenase [Candidatus Kentron sp. SD]
MNFLEVSERIDGLSIEKRAFINGRYVNATDNRMMEKISPANGRDLSGLASCQQQDVDAAVAAAKAAYSSRVWADRGPDAKKEVLFRLANLMEENLEELALLDTLETGRSIRNYLYDSVPKAIKAIRWFSEAVDKFYDHAIPMRPTAFATVTRESLGVVGLITPWNDPLVVSAWKFAPALLMGNSVVLKPAEQSSFSILKVAELAKQAGIPDGVFNVIPGEGEVAGKALALHPDVAGIFFTGSSDVGKQILQYAGQSNMKKVGLECGGKGPFIVSDKCRHLDEAATTLARNMFYNQGQICSAPSRLFVHKAIKEPFLEQVLTAARDYVPKDPFNPLHEVGCVVSLEQRRRIDAYIAQAVDSGARILMPAHDAADLPGECAVVPTIIDRVGPDDDFVREEIFGPVLCVIAFDSIRQAVRLANDSRFGLAGSVWTDDLNEAYQVSRLLEVGIVHINGYGDDDNTVPFGGVKESGIGKDKSLYAFEEYSATKTVWTRFEPMPFDN